MRQKTIEPQIAEIINTATIDGNLLTLNCGQLDGKTYEKVNEVLDSCGGKWKTKLEAHQFNGDPTEKIEAVLGTGILPEKNPLAYWPTPGPVVAAMIQAACIGGLRRPISLLEPSAGEGAICDEACNNGVLINHVTAYEIDPTRCKVLDDKGYEAICTDFLSIRPGMSYDRILMNPPFAITGNAQVYIDHIEHAWKFLAPHGILVAIAPGSLKFRSDKRVKALRELCEANGYIEDLPDAAFKASGTGVGTVMVVLRNYDS